MNCNTSRMVCISLRNPSSGLVDPDLMVGQIYDCTPVHSIAGEFYTVNIAGIDHDKPQSLFQPEGYVRPLRAIARDIHRNWNSVHYAARPYLSAMSTLDSIDDSLCQDSGRSIVAYFLANASSWRGEVARRIKAELKLMLKGVKK